MPESVSNFHRLFSWISGTAKGQPSRPISTSLTPSPASLKLYPRRRAAESRCMSWSSCVSLPEDNSLVRGPKMLFNCLRSRVSTACAGASTAASGESYVACASGPAGGGTNEASLVWETFEGTADSPVDRNRCDDEQPNRRKTPTTAATSIFFLIMAKPPRPFLGLLFIYGRHLRRCACRRPRESTAARGTRSAPTGRTAVSRGARSPPRLNALRRPAGCSSAETVRVGVGVRLVSLADGMLGRLTGAATWGADFLNALWVPPQDAAA